MSSRNGADRSCTIEDYSDRELTNLLLDLADYEGWVDPAALGEQLRIDARKAVARLAWIRRYGLVEKHPDYGKLSTDGEPIRYWRLTERGVKFAKGRLRKETRDRLERLDEGDFVDLAEIVTERYRTAKDPSSALLIRRDLRWGLSNRRFR